MSARHLIPALLLFISYPFTASHAKPYGEPLTVSSAQSCRSDFDCKPGNFCLLRGPVGICRSKLGLNQPCTRGAPLVDTCQPGLHCGFVGFTDPAFRCVTQAGPGRYCSPRNPTACRAPLVCDDTLCRPARPAGPGAPCGVDADCTAGNKLFCTDNRRCERKRPPLEPCNPRLSNECDDGFCASFFPGGGQCVAQQPVGGLCISDSNCKDSTPSSPRADRVVCNRREANKSQDYGTCIQYSSLRRRVGQDCDRVKAPCDYERGLFCTWAAHKRRHVCQHRSSFVTPKENRFCVPESRLSSCPDPDTTCRVSHERGILMAFTQCLRKVRVVPRGTRCDDEPVRCSGGAACRAVRGVGRSKMGGPSSDDSGAATFYCVTLVGEGGECREKFRTQCKSGLVCANGTTCRRTGGAPSGATTHSGLRGRCERLPCAPGLQCSDAKRCEVRTVRGGWGARCGVTVVNRLGCRDAFACRRDNNRAGPLRCRLPVKVGGRCDSSACEPGLRCLKKTRLEGEEFDEFCFDPKNEVAFGKACKPGSQRFGPTCRPDGPELARPVRCLPKGVGHSCQIDAGLLQKCDPSRNTVCGDSRLNCSANGLCILKK